MDHLLSAPSQAPSSSRFLSKPNPFSVYIAVVLLLLPLQVATTTAPAGDSRARELTVAASTRAVMASTLANTSSLPSERSVVLEMQGGIWNTTWCAEAPRIVLSRGPESANVSQPCGLLSVAKESIAKIACTPHALRLTFYPVPTFALMRSMNESIEYRFLGPFSVPLATVGPFPLTVIADQGPNVTCASRATMAPTRVPPTQPWPTAIYLGGWNGVYWCSAFINVAAASSLGVMHLVWFHRITFLSSRNCGGENVPVTVSFADSFLDDDPRSRALGPFVSELIVNLCVCVGVTVLHFGCAFAEAARCKGRLARGMANVKFPGAVTFPVWLLFYVLTVSASTTIFANSVDKPDAVVLGITMFVLGVFVAVMAVHFKCTKDATPARAVEVHAAAVGKYWVVLPTVDREDGRFCRFDHYTPRFGTLFKQFTEPGRHRLWGELVLLTFQAAIMGRRSPWPECTTNFLLIGIPSTAILLHTVIHRLISARNSYAQLAVFSDRVTALTVDVVLGVVCITVFATGGSVPLDRWATPLDTVVVVSTYLSTMVYAAIMMWLRCVLALQLDLPPPSPSQDEPLNTIQVLMNPADAVAGGGDGDFGEPMTLMSV